MSDPFLGEIKLVSFNFPPKGWAFCNGQLLPINQNQALFSILGTTYGGDGRTTFALPNLQGRVPTHAGNGLTLGQAGGEVAHTLSTQELPAHQHAVVGTSAPATSGVPGTGVVLATSAGAPAYAPPSNLVPMDPSAVQTVGGGQPHENRQPYLTVNFCIALVGIFPSQN